MKEVFVLTRTDVDGTIIKQIVSDDEMKVRAIMEKDFQNEREQALRDYDETEISIEQNRYSCSISVYERVCCQWNLLNCEFL